ncbi:hypothetical protein [Trichocoleus sp. FACHB-262]|uniref:hypothetical protein n=1 Tax=Trichocoleus sp. FACHB-262 TaxID=2692869 RepID=UPI0016835479|nr:hypothetical protein [Trichocoleus sp. FACHB-262]MBD2124770.1 hypothetical protein [Trichocoleus sp. FACHB-262]
MTANTTDSRAYISIALLAQAFYHSLLITVSQASGFLQISAAHQNAQAPSCRVRPIARTAVGHLA